MLLGIAMVVGAGIAFKDRIREEWYIHEMKSSEGEEGAPEVNFLGQLSRVEEANEGAHSPGIPVAPELRCRLAGHHRLPTGQGLPEIQSWQGADY